jgi:hypothetical protein
MCPVVVGLCGGSDTGSSRYVYRTVRESGKEEKREKIASTALNMTDRREKKWRKEILS